MTYVQHHRVLDFLLVFVYSFIPGIEVLKFYRIVGGGVYVVVLFLSHEHKCFICTCEELSPNFVMSLDECFKSYTFKSFNFRLKTPDTFSSVRK